MRELLLFIFFILSIKISQECAVGTDDCATCVLGECTACNTAGWHIKSDL